MLMPTPCSGDFFIKMSKLIVYKMDIYSYRLQHQRFTCNLDAVVCQFLYFKLFRLKTDIDLETVVEIGIIK